MTLREFFVELLHGDNLAAYYSDRERYIVEQAASLIDDDRELLLTGTLGQIEARIMEEHYSPSPKPVMFVYPPM